MVSAQSMGSNQMTIHIKMLPFQKENKGLFEKTFYHQLSSDTSRTQVWSHKRINNSKISGLVSSINQWHFTHPKLPCTELLSKNYFWSGYFPYIYNPKCKMQNYNKKCAQQNALHHWYSATINNQFFGSWVVKFIFDYRTINKFIYLFNKARFVYSLFFTIDLFVNYDRRIVRARMSRNEKIFICNKNQRDNCR